MKKKKLLFCFLLYLLPCFCGHAQKLTHVRGFQAVGIRGGIGIKNIVDVGVTYNYHFNPKISLSVEVDHERAVFGHSDYVGIILASPGVDYSPWSPGGWCYITFNLAASLGCDQWTSEIIHAQKRGFVYGGNAGFAWEVMPWSFLSFVLKAQEYMIFGNEDQYLKPMFTLGIRYNFHK